MIMDLVFIVILIIAVATGKKQGLFRSVGKLIATVAALAATLLFHAQAEAWLAGTPLYLSLFNTLTKSMASSGMDNVLLKPFIDSSAGAFVAQSAAKSILSLLISVLFFILASLVVRLVISLLDKIIFQLPVIKPLNRLCGLIWGVVFTIALAYLLVAICGGLALFSGTGVLAEQMETSVIIKYMYVHNPILDWARISSGTLS